MPLGEYIFSLSASLIACGILIIFYRRYRSFFPNRLCGPQTIHDKDVPRIGGLALLVSTILAAALFSHMNDWLVTSILLASSLAFFIGFYEDLSDNTSPVFRLLFSFLPGVTFVFLTKITITRSGVGFVDEILSIELVTMFLTVLSITALLHATNMIDGLNGLASGVGLISSLTLCTFLVNVEGTQLTILAGVFGFSVLGFALLNFWKGAIFLGDGGAYFIGSFLSMSLIAVSEMNTEVSPFAILLTVAYPFTELVNTIRRRIEVGKSPFLADDAHFHSLIFRSLREKLNFDLLRINVLSSSLCLILHGFCCFWAIIHQNDTFNLIFGLLVFILGYQSIYLVLGKRSKD